MFKIIGADGKEYGPITADQLRQWIADGRVNAQTKVWVEGATDWRTLAELPEFATFVPSGPPAMTPIQAPGTVSEGQVNGPAIGLMITAILGFLGQAVSLIWRLVGTSMMATDERMPAWAIAFSGTMGVVASIVGILMSALILIGALKMKKLENYGLAMTASVIAMIPCISPCCLLGLPIGIWALVVLSKPEVKSTFH